MKHRIIYLSPDILQWRPHSPGGLILSDADKHRAYDHLLRAEHFIKLEVVEDADLADCLGNLRRAVTHRTQLLEKLYRLRVPLQAGAKKHFIELLAQVGIVRPSFLRALLAARNAVEYRDRKPPSRWRCQEMADAVWYFLRSTDPLVLTRRDYFELSPSEDGYPDETYGFGVHVRYSSRFRFEISGWSPRDLVSLLPKAGWLEVRADEFYTKQERWKNEPMHADKKDEDCWFSGILSHDVNGLSSLLMLAFEAD